MKKIFKSIIICLVLILSITNVYATDEIVIIEEIGKANEALLDECLAEIKPIIEERWASGDKDETNQGTHGFIVSQGLSIVESKYSAVNNYFTSARTKTLLYGSIEPDITGAQTLFKDHFYLENGEGLAGYPLSAYDNFRNHYNGAVANYKAGKHTDAISRLGKALHYISDINEPHHTTGKIAGPTSRHDEYEAWVEARFNSYAVTSMTSSALTNYGNNSLLTIADASADVSRNQITNAESTSTTSMGNATNVCLKRAQKDAAGVIYKFAKDVGLI